MCLNEKRPRDDRGLFVSNNEISPFSPIPVFHGERVAAKLTGEGFPTVAEPLIRPFGPPSPVKNGEKEER